NSATKCLTGSLYQVLQSTGADGKNFLQLIPVTRAKENPVPAVSSPVITNAPLLNVHQPVRLSLPSAVSNVALPMNAQLVQQLGSANYIITTQKSPADASKTIRVDNKLSPVILKRPPSNLPSNPQMGTPSFLIMNAGPGSGPMKTIPIFPTGHSLQIPAHAEVKSVPASSLPFSLQQRMLPPNTSNDATKIPSVVYVSPVNTLQTPPASYKPKNSVTQPSAFAPMLVPAVQSSTTATPKGPLKWVVQENTESKACVVPVKSNSEMANKILALMSGAKTEDLNSTSSNVAKFKDNTLVMCDNKIYFLTKQGAELRSTIHIKQETPDKTALQIEQGKDLANKVVEVVLSKNNLPPLNSKPTLDSASSPLVLPDAGVPAKPKTCTRPQVSKKIPEVIYIDDEDDEEDAIQKPKGASHYQPTTTSSAKVYTPSASLGSPNTDNQAKGKEAEMTKITKSPAPRVIDDRTLRARFGIFRREKIILNRIPLLCPEGKSDSREVEKDMMLLLSSMCRHLCLLHHLELTVSCTRLPDEAAPDCAHNFTTNQIQSEGPEKRKSAFSETSHISKQRKSEETEDPAGGYPKPSSSTTVHAPAGWSDTRDTTSGGRTFSSLAGKETGTKAACGNPSTSQSAQNSGPEMYTDPSGSHSFYTSQDISGHFSEAPLPRQRFHIESSAYPDETTKDEKIQRLKEVLKEREQALEALRRQKWS
ncbi:PREDICTED: ligand-dependent nuclear receptor-interacting factor 1, partial [Nanorana parkeri]|uniref:ligand-dependent nuclear receptor-interacting factor 1 n=1 Tax=Nanorana parkeri TaxID=125878 RepID=UPI0008547AD9